MIDPYNLLIPSNEWVSPEGEVRAFDIPPEYGWAQLPTPESAVAQLGMARYLARVQGEIDEEEEVFYCLHITRDGIHHEVVMFFDKDGRWTTDNDERVEEV